MIKTNENQKHIILVEDEETLTNIMRAKLERAGFRVTLAGNGEEGLSQIRSQNPDLVLLDMMLPVLNGFDLLETLRREGILPALPVIVISNSGQPVELERIKRLGVRDYLIKINFSPEEVLQKVEQVLSLEDQIRPAKIPQEQKTKANVLIVEDDMILVNLLQRKFSQDNYMVFTAPNVSEARQVLKSGPVDIILLDIVFPDMDGFTFLAELKAGKEFAHIPVIIISNLGQKEEIEKGIKIGAVDYVIKANTFPNEILEKVKDVLQKKNMDKE